MSFYDRTLVPALDSVRNPLLFILRLFIGWQFAVTGLGKLQSIDRIIEFFAGLGIPAPAVAAYGVAFLESIGGILLAIGLAARLTAVPLAATMIVALATADRAAVGNVFREPDALLMAAPFPFLVVSLIVVAFGPGAISVDRFLRSRSRRPVASSRG